MVMIQPRGRPIKTAKTSASAARFMLDPRCS
jgi:hypothetical protein